MEILKIAFGSLHANKLRSTLTILGIIVGIFSIIAISTIISMLQTSIEDGVSQLGKNTFQIQKWPSVRTGGREERAKIRNRKDLTLEEYYSLEDKLVNVKSIGAEIWGFGKVVKFQNEETNPNVSISGCTPGAFPNNNWDVEFGREFNESDVSRYERVIVLGADVAKKIFINTDPIGEEVWIDGNKLKVIGLLADEGEIFGQSRGNFALIPISTYQGFYGKRTRSVNITISSFSRDDYEDVIEKTEGYFRTIRKVPPGEDNDFEIFSNQSVLSQINQITSGVRIGAFVIAAIALLAAGVGIMNIMLVSVTERTREIGIRKAIGAKRKTILIQFLSEAIVLCLIGGLVGIVSGVVVGNLAGSLLEAKAVIPMDYVMIGVLLCVLIGIIFGTYPAYKASNLDPIEALRYE
ncbi:MAG: ABC transporter permease [Bacteroidetes bacterium]|nr:ABC transporter permease [Bacteroidota bacterium]